MTSPQPDARLESILSESVASARQRERSAFDEAAGPFAQSMVLYGAGNLGRNILRGLRKNGIDPIAFADANPALAAKQVEGVPVFSPEDAAKRFGGSAIFVIGVWHPDSHCGVHHIAEKLAQLGAQRVVPFSLLFWKYPDTFLPYYYWDLPSRILASASEITRGYELYAGDLSKVQLVRDLELRTHARFAALPLADSGKQYFPAHLFRISPDECFIDCGAYDGDTIRDLVSETHGKFRRVVAFEVDPKNFQRLRQSVAAMPELHHKIFAREAAVAKTTGTLRFAATAGSNASVSSSGDQVVPCVSLDDALTGETPTYIKIEGSELDALDGASRTIAAHKPVLAVCLYHCPSHFWEIPLRLKRVEPDAVFYLRSYSVDGWESVCYAVPPERTLAP